MKSRLDPTGKDCITLGDVFSTSDRDGYELDPDTVINKPGKPVGWLVHYVTYVTWFAAKGIYESIAQNEDFRAVLTAFVAMTIGFFTIGIVGGIITYRLNDTLMFGIKLMIVLTFATNWEPFEQLIFTPLEGELVRSGSDYVVASEGAILSMSKMAVYAMGSVEAPLPTDINAPEPLEEVVEDVDNMLMIMVSWDFWKLILALLSTGLQGWIYAALLIAMLITYFWAMVAAIQVLLMAIIARALLYAIAPVIFVCLLFQATKQVFMAWLEQILSYSLQPILIFMWLGVINLHIMDFIVNMPTRSSDEICYLPFISLPIVSFLPDLHWWIFSSGTIQKPESRGPFTDIPINVWYLVGAICMSYILHEMTNWTVSVAKMISGGVVSVGDVKAFGYETVKEGVQTPFKEGFAFLGGAVMGAKDDDGQKRKKGAAGAMAEFVARKGGGKGFTYHILGGAQQMQRKARRQNIRDLSETFNKDFGLGGGGRKAAKSKTMHDIRQFTPRDSGGGGNKGGGGHSPWG